MYCPVTVQKKCMKFLPGDLAAYYSGTATRLKEEYNLISHKSARRTFESTFKFAREYYRNDNKSFTWTRG